MVEAESEEKKDDDTCSSRGVRGPNDDDGQETSQESKKQESSLVVWRSDQTHGVSKEELELELAMRQMDKMGFDRAQAMAAYFQCNRNVDRAVNMLLNIDSNKRQDRGLLACSDGSGKTPAVTPSTAGNDELNLHQTVFFEYIVERLVARGYDPSLAAQALQACEIESRAISMLQDCANRESIEQRMSVYTGDGIPSPRNSALEFQSAGQLASVGDSKAAFGLFVNFAHWKQAANGGKATSLEHQFTLARELYLQASGLSAGHDQLPGVEEIMVRAATTPLENMDTIVTDKGIHVGWFLNIFCTSPYMVRLCEFGCEAWFVRKVCVIVMVILADQEGAGQAFVDHIPVITREWNLDTPTSNESVVNKPTAFLSYTGAYTLKHVIESLKGLDPSTYIWMDIFSVNQFAWTGRGKCGEMVPLKGKFVDDVDTLIRDIKHTALVLDKWENVMMTLGQIWVLWEIFNTSKAGAKFEVLLTEEQEREIVHNWLESSARFDRTVELLSGAAELSAEHKEERDAILDRMKKTGLEGVNTMLLAMMRDWLVEQGKRRLEQRRSESDEPSVELLSNLALLLQSQGNLVEAEKMFQEVVARKTSKYGKDHPCTLESTDDLAGVLRCRGKEEEAASLQDEKLFAQCLGKRRGSALTFIRALTMELAVKDIITKADNAQQESERLREATIHGLASPEQFFEWLEGVQQLFGDEHPATLRTMITVADALWLHGKESERAIELCQQALEGMQKRFGCDHTYCIACKRSLNRMARPANGPIHPSDCSEGSFC